MVAELAEGILKRKEQELVEKFAELVTKRCRREEPEVYKSKSIGNQMKHNDELRDTVDDALELLTAGDVQGATTSIEKGVSLIKKRSKILKLADREGSDCVTAYLKDKIADGPEDEKRIRKAIKMAKEEAERAKEKAKKSKSSSSGSSGYSGYGHRGSTFSTYKRGGGYQKYRGNGASRGGCPGRGGCWHCGGTNHFISRCLKLKNSRR